MTITLETLAIGDVNYVSKHNANYATIKSAIDVLQATVTGASGAVVNYPPFAIAVFGAVVGRMSVTGALATDGGSALLDITAGSVWHPTNATVRTGGAATLDFTGQATDTYFTHIDSFGTWTFDTTSVDAVHTIAFTSPTTFTTITQPVVVWGDVANQNAKLSAVLGSTSFEELDQRLEAGEGASQLIHPETIDDPDDVTLTTDDALQHAVFLITGTLTADRDFIVPNFEKPYIVINDSTGSFDITVKTAAGTGVVVGQGAMSICVCDGTDVRSEFIGGDAAAVPVPYVISSWKNGLPGTGERVMAHTFPDGITGLALAASATNSSCEAETSATAETDFDVQKNDVSIGTIRWAISGTVATFVGFGGDTFAAGDRLEIIAPTQDATLAEVYFTLYLTRDG